jgi:hypothetical protein
MSRACANLSSRVLNHIMAAESAVQASRCDMESGG